MTLVDHLMAEADKQILRLTDKDRDLLRSFGERLEPLKTGDKARKVGGSYSATGLIVSAFLTRSGALRYVFEFDGFPGMLHIFNDTQLERMDEPQHP